MTTKFYEGCAMLGGVCDCDLANKPCALGEMPVQRGVSGVGPAKPFAPDLASDHGPLWPPS